jgi:hypothetical protein
MSGRARLPAGAPLKASQRGRRRAPPSKVSVMSVWRTGDRHPPPERGLSSLVRFGIAAGVGIAAGAILAAAGIGTVLLKNSGADSVTAVIALAKEVWAAAPHRAPSTDQAMENVTGRTIESFPQTGSAPIPPLSAAPAAVPSLVAPSDEPTAPPVEPAAPIPAAAPTALPGEPDGAALDPSDRPPRRTRSSPAAPVNIPAPRVEHADTQLDQAQMPSAPAALLPALGTEHQLAKKAAHHTSARTVRKAHAFAGRGSPFSIHGVLTPPEPSVWHGRGD